MKNHPVDIILPVYNSQKYLAECLNSLFQQTFREFRILALDDCSNDGSIEILNTLKRKDKRLEIFKNEQNRGHIFSRNKLLEISKAPFLAFADSDDVYKPCRIEKQLDLLTKKKDVGAVSSSIEILGTKEILTRPESTSDVDSFLTFTQIFPSPVATVKSEKIKLNRLKYSEKYTGAADYKFWSQFSKISKLTNIKEPLFMYRRHENQVTSLKNKNIMYKSHLLIVEEILLSYGIGFCEKILTEFIWQKNILEKWQLDQVCRYILNIVELFRIQNKENHAFICDRHLRSICKRHRKNGLISYFHNAKPYNIIRGKNFSLNFAFSCLRENITKTTENH